MSTFKKSYDKSKEKFFSHPESEVERVIKSFEIKKSGLSEVIPAFVLII